jgi:hypothetical protein
MKKVLFYPVAVPFVFGCRRVVFCRNAHYFEKVSDLAVKIRIKKTDAIRFLKILKGRFCMSAHNTDFFWKIARETEE